MPRRLYLGNKTGKTVTLKVDNALVADSSEMFLAFKYALDGKRIKPGHITINFGKGKWDKPDEESLKKLLQKIVIIKDGEPTGYRLPKNLPIGHGTLIPELIVYINEP